MEANETLESKVDERRKDLQFEVGNWAMAHLNKDSFKKTSQASYK